ncbi:MAG: hypothetical protein ACRCYP_03640 [Alphaproteobacteria bacterium]
MESVKLLQNINDRPVEVGYWLDRLGEKVRSRASEITWKKDYYYALYHLPQKAPLTIDLLYGAIMATAPHSKPRRRLVNASKAIAKLAGLDITALEGLGGSYGINHVTPRDLPGEGKILECWGAIANQKGRWAYGMMATFGVRPHEVFQCDRDEFLRNPEYLYIYKDTKTGRKTGGRTTRAIHPEWVKEFSLMDIPDGFGSRASDNSGKGHNVSRWFRLSSVPFEPYNLRHAWAVRCLLLGIPDVVAAQMMGHSIAHHQQIYLHWIRQRDINRVVDEALARRVEC